MKIRNFQSSDTPHLIQLFRDTVHRVCRADYDTQQLSAWAPNTIDAERWTTRFLNSFTVIAEEDGAIYGFANLESNGNVDMFYVHADRQGMGVGSLLFSALEGHAGQMEVKQLSSDVSITARPFFLKQGFKVEREYVKDVLGVAFKNFMMSKFLREQA